MAPVFKTTAADVIDVFTGEGDDSTRRDYVEGKDGMNGQSATFLFYCCIFGRNYTNFFYTIWIFASFIFSLVLCLTTFALGAIAVKVMGETSIEPVSGTSFIVLLMLVLIFKAIGLNESDTAILALVGTTVFGGAISMSGTVIGDYKPGLYVGNRPMHIMKTELVGIVPGTIVAALFAGLLSLALAKGDLFCMHHKQMHSLLLPRLCWAANSLELLIVGVVIGVFMELLTGYGDCFWFGNVSSYDYNSTNGCWWRFEDYWEAKFLDVSVEKEGLTEKQRTMKLLNTYMIATGCIVGEALLGTFLAIYYVLPLITG